MFAWLRICLEKNELALAGSDGRILLSESNSSAFVMLSVRLLQQRQVVYRYSEKNSFLVACSEVRISDLFLYCQKMFSHRGTPFVLAHTVFDSFRYFVK